jgi:putative transposase
VGVAMEKGLSERRACQLVGLHRSTQRLEPLPNDDGPMKERLKMLAAQRPRFGQRRLWRMLRRSGVVINHKRVERLYREEGLQVRRKKRKRLSGRRENILAFPVRPNQTWSMDFVYDVLANGRAFRSLTIVDNFTKQAPAIEADFSLPGARVARVLDWLKETHGLPETIIVDNGTEFVSKAMDEWAHKNNVALHFIQPGKPNQNCYIESFNGRYRDEFLNQHVFQTLEEAQDLIESWRDDYNRHRPHSSLDGLTPHEFILKWQTEKQKPEADPKAQISHF